MQKVWMELMFGGCGWVCGRKCLA